jgi:ABC-2 type transport system permease protein
MTEMVIIVARYGVVLLLYAYVYRLNGGVIKGLTFNAAMWSIFFYFVLFLMGIRNISRTIMQDVRSGAVELLFNKPISYIGYRVWWQVGSGLYPCIVVSSLGAFMLWMTIGIPHSMTLGLFIPTFIAMFLGGVLLTACVYSIIGLLAFWIDDVDPVYWIVDKMLMMVGGAFIPVALMPSFMQTFAAYSPFGAVYFISHTTYDSWVHNWWQLASVQLMWIVVMASMMFYLFECAKKRVSVNGG